MRSPPAQSRFVLFPRGLAAPPPKSSRHALPLEAPKAACRSGRSQLYLQSDGCCPLEVLLAGLVQVASIVTEGRPRPAWRRT